MALSTFTMCEYVIFTTVHLQNFFMVPNWNSGFLKQWLFIRLPLQPLVTTILLCFYKFIRWASPWLRGKESPCSAGDVGSIPELERSPGEGNDYPLQYSCLENSMDRGGLMGYSPLSCKILGHSWATNQQSARYWCKYPESCMCPFVSGLFQGAYVFKIYPCL